MRRKMALAILHFSEINLISSNLDVAPQFDHFDGPVASLAIRVRTTVRHREQAGRLPPFQKDKKDKKPGAELDITDIE